METILKYNGKVVCDNNNEMDDRPYQGCHTDQNQIFVFSRALNPFHVLGIKVSLIP